MEIVIDGCLLKDVDNNKLVVSDIITHVGHEYFDPNLIERAMGAYDEERNICGYFLTCSFLGVRSFHGFKFIRGRLPVQLAMARKYIDMEDLKYSSYRNKEAKIFLRALGFKDIYQINNITVAKR